MKAVKKIMAVIALLAMLVFVASIIILIVTGTWEVNAAWVYVSLSVFLFFGLLAVIIDYFQRKLGEKNSAERE